MEQGPTEKFIIEQCIRQNMPLPDAIANAPVLEIGLDLFFTAFMDLNSCRNIGVGEGPIPWTAKQMYAKEELNLEGEQRDDFFYYINRLDTAYLDHKAKQRKE